MAWCQYRWNHPAYNFNIKVSTVDQITFAPVEATVGAR
jgi:hypothetical protein